MDGLSEEDKLGDKEADNEGDSLGDNEEDRLGLRDGDALGDNEGLADGDSEVIKASLCSVHVTPCVSTPLVCPLFQKDVVKLGPYTAGALGSPARVDT